MARGRPSRETVYARLDSAIDELTGRMGGLPSPKEAQYIWDDIWHLEAHHSTALEGNTLVLREVEALLEKGRAVGAKPLREYMEVQGYGQASHWVYGHALEPDWTGRGLISLSEIRQIHELAMTPVWQVAPHEHATDREAPGCFREHDIRPFPGGMRPPQWPMVPALMQDWVDQVIELEPILRSEERLAPLPELLAQIHSGFEQVHPFIDGNGRTGRLVLNLLLVRLGLPPIIILKQKRPDYLSALQKSDDGDHGPLGELLARAMYDNLNRFILPGVAGPARMVPLQALADEDFTVAALRQAAARGRLDAVQGADGLWRSSRKAVDDYARSKSKRRSRPKESQD